MSLVAYPGTHQPLWQVSKLSLREIGIGSSSNPHSVLRRASASYTGIKISGVPGYPGTPVSSEEPCPENSEKS
eukprot:980179-Rhodomonas_salina.1